MTIYGETYLWAGIGNSGQMWTSSLARPITTIYVMLSLKAFTGY
jgi:hypothetical protein